MARSEEAIRRRAEKRQRSEEDQRKQDRLDMEETLRRRRRQEQEQQQQQKQQHSNENNGNTSTHNTGGGGGDVDERLKEVGAWICPGCQNHNFASRYWCNSKTCDEKRPDDIPQPTSQNHPTKYPRRPKNDHYGPGPLDEEGAWSCPTCNFRNYASRERCKGQFCQQRRPGGMNTTKTSNTHTTTTTTTTTTSRKSHPRHDPSTSKTLVWSKQADNATMSENQRLRIQYQQTAGGVGMSEEDQKRAKILLARDERKRQRRKTKQSKIHGGDGEGETEEIHVNNGGVDKDAKNGSVKAITQNQETFEKTPSSSSSSSSMAHDKDKQPSVLSSSIDTIKIQRKINKKLRKRFVTTGGDGMTEEEIERAKQLIARDERKRLKAAKYAAATTTHKQKETATLKAAE